MKRLPNRFFNSEEISLEGIIKVCRNELAAIDQRPDLVHDLVHDLGRVPRRAQVLFKAALDLNELQIPQAIEEMEKLLFYYPFDIPKKETNIFDQYAICFDRMDNKLMGPKKSAISNMIYQKFLGLGNLEKALRYALLASKFHTFHFIPEFFTELFQKEREDLAISFASQTDGSNQQQAFFELAKHFFRKGLFDKGFDFAEKVDLLPFKERIEWEMKSYLPPLTD